MSEFTVKFVRDLRKELICVTQWQNYPFYLYLRYFISYILWRSRLLGYGLMVFKQVIYKGEETQSGLQFCFLRLEWELFTWWTVNKSAMVCLRNWATLCPEVQICLCKMGIYCLRITCSNPHVLLTCLLCATYLLTLYLLICKKRLRAQGYINHTGVNSHLSIISLKNTYLQFLRGWKINETDRYFKNSGIAISIIFNIY